MRTAIGLLHQAVEAGEEKTARKWAKVISEDQAWQLKADPKMHWPVFNLFCPSRLEPSVQKGVNALRIESNYFPSPRCKRLSPDDRGIVWYLSGGAIEAYGRCCVSACPLLRKKSNCQCNQGGSHGKENKKILFS